MNCDSSTELLISTHSNKYINFNARLHSFIQKSNRIWPHIGVSKLSPYNMAQAGFFYNPNNDSKDAVSCPFCLKTLADWKDGDDPLVEHDKRSDNCFFARLKKHERDWTVDDYLRLRAQRHVSIVALKAVASAVEQKNFSCHKFASMTEKKATNKRAEVDRK